MQTIPSPVKLSPELAKQLRKLEEKKRAINQFIQMMTQQGEQQIANYNEQARQVWQLIEKTTGVDLVNVLWVPHPFEDSIVPVQVKIKENTLSGPDNKVS